MSSRLDDPRQFPTRLEWPTTFEGAEQFPKWDAKLLDLDELPVEEYMKPMPVNVVSGGTGPGPTPPTPSGETSFFATFIASGETFANISVTSGQTVPADQVPIPFKEGYTFSGWTPDPETTVITANTTFNGEFIENEKPNTTMYYQLAMVLSGSPFDVDALDSCDISEFKKEADYTIDESELYITQLDRTELDEDDPNYLSEDEFWDWVAYTFTPENKYVTRIVVPDGYKVKSSTDEMLQPYIVPENPTPVEVDGKQFYCYDIAGKEYERRGRTFYQFTPADETLPFTEIITIEQKNN